MTHKIENIKRRYKQKQYDNNNALLHDIQFCLNVNATHATRIAHLITRRDNGASFKIGVVI